MTNIWQKLKFNKQPFLALGPLDGVTDFVFREIVAVTAKPDVMFTEFTNVDALTSKGYEKTIERLKYSGKQKPIIAQIWGNKPENFSKTAKLINELGFDGIDINMGCPDKTVMKNGSGASLINNPQLTAEIIAAVKEDDLPISVKTRIGTNEIVTEKWIGFLLEQKLDALTIHGRTAVELSKVPAHWAEIRKGVEIAKQISPETVIIGNGDIMNIEEAKEAHQKYGVDGILIGRGIFANPWFFENPQKIHSIAEHLQLLLKHTRLYCEIYPEKKRFDAMKKFFKIYVKSFEGSHKLKTDLMNTKSYIEVEGLINSFLSSK